MLVIVALYSILDKNSEIIEICNKMQGVFSTRSQECIITSEDYTYILDKDTLNTLIEVKNTLNIK